MKTNSLKNYEIIQKSLKLTDSLAELDGIIEKLNILSYDVCYNYIEKFSFKTERGRLTSEIDFNIIRVMSDVINSHLVEAAKISKNLPELSEEILQSLKE